MRNPSHSNFALAFVCVILSGGLDPSDGTHVDCEISEVWEFEEGRSYTYCEQSSRQAQGSLPLGTHLPWECLIGASPPPPPPIVSSLTASYLPRLTPPPPMLFLWCITDLPTRTAVAACVDAWHKRIVWACNTAHNETTILPALPSQESKDGFCRIRANVHLIAHFVFQSGKIPELGHNN